MINNYSFENGDGLFLQRYLPLLFAIAICTWASPKVQAQLFSSKSTGERGDVTISEDTTLDLPNNGELHYVSLSVAEGATLTFNRNNLNTPVYILATGTISVEGTIDVSGSSGARNPPAPGQGGPGGFDGGHPGTADTDPSDGQGPGAGKGGSNSGFASPGNAGAGAYAGQPTPPITDEDGNAYGSSLLIPLVGGSGGGGMDGAPGRGGAGGGGAILLASDTRIDISGSILAKGGDNAGDSLRSPAQGSGGAIRLVAPIVSGAGTLNVRGGHSEQYLPAGIDGGRGRIRIDRLDRGVLNLNFQPLASLSQGTFMAVFPDSLPRLDIIEVAGNPIAEGTTNPEEYTFLFPFGTSTSQQVVIKATNFTGTVPPFSGPGPGVR